MKKDKEPAAVILKQILSAWADPGAVPVPLDAGIDRWTLIKMLQYHKLTPFAYLLFRRSEDTADKMLLDDLKRKYDLNLARNIRFQEEFIRLHNIFKGENIDIFPFKGLALLADIYSQYPVRPMKDMDILVREEDLEKAESLLERHGYRKHLGKGSYHYWRYRNLNIPFLKEDGNWLLELHFAVDLKRRKRILPEMWKRTGAFRTGGTQINMLSPEDTLFSLALHQRRFGDPLCLKNSLDAALLLERHAGSFDWDYVCREAEEGGMRTTLFFALIQAELFAGYRPPRQVMKRLRVPAWKRLLIRMFVERNAMNMRALSRPKRLYLQSHFLLYDCLLEPAQYVLRVTREEFAKFYGLPLYAKKTETLYRIRFLFMLCRLFSGGGEPENTTVVKHG